MAMVTLTFKYAPTLKNGEIMKFTTNHIPGKCPKCECTKWIVENVKWTHTGESLIKNGEVMMQSRCDSCGYIME